MKKKSLLPYLLLFCVILVLMSRSKFAADQIRGLTAAVFSPLWQWMTPTKQENSDLLKLQTENQLLKNELLRSHQLLKETFYLKKELHQLFGDINSDSYNARQHILKKRLEAIPAHVIYRASASWNSFFWINVGASTNQTLNRQVVMKNSPVVVGNSLVGVIDYVGQRQSRVRLITDSGLYPAVRAVRGNPQGIRLVETIHVLLDNLAEYEGLFDSTEAKEQLIGQLEKTQEALHKQQETFYLAKGELQGSSSPHKRSHGNLLKGVGFNYDFADDKGPARDLRTGIPDGESYSKEPIPLLKVHDLLVTTGMDGLFPEGLHVAEVISVEPLEEGAYYYQLQAKPTAGNLDSLSLVFVMAPQGFDPEDNESALN
ncbi:MAG: rod shape-determining protein MreC [Parachlamydiaceae bacterium]